MKFIFDIYVILFTLISVSIAQKPTSNKTEINNISTNDNNNNNNNINNTSPNPPPSND